jgi:hypothetical protein
VQINYAKSSKALKELDLSRCNISVELVVELILQAQNLQYLDISDNELGDKRLMVIFDKLATNKNSIKHLSIDRSPHIPSIPFNQNQSI